MNEIKNFVQLTANIGTAGQPLANQFDLIRDNGFEVVINLAMPDNQASISDEGKIVTELGMTYIHLPVPFDAPKPRHIKEFCGYMESLGDRKIFVHCIMNYRVSAFMYHYLSKIKKMDDQASRSEIFKQWNMEPEWVDVLKWDKEIIGL